MQVIAVDIGNSSTKVAVEDPGSDGLWLTQTVLRAENPVVFGSEFISVLEESTIWSLSSVNRQREHQLQDWISTNRPKDYVHTIAESDVPLKSNVESREQLGRDRLIAAQAAVKLNNNSGPLIVVDAGTAVTIDYVGENNVFEGGFIFPGAEANFRILNQNTHDLPDLSVENGKQDVPKFEIGKSTTSAILNGVNQSQIQAIKGMVNELRVQFGSDLPVYATGGGLNLIRSQFPDDWHYTPDLVLQGTLEIGRCLAAEFENK